ncbi:MAG: T9SS type A sorting domain-containing protein [Candidatus Latescibacteria bacterium]|nr:T9SS type A sorting domain-containing protein [Candidatus Latescibacterota bacterium]
MIVFSQRATSFFLITVYWLVSSGARLRTSRGARPLLNRLGPLVLFLFYVWGLGRPALAAQEAAIDFSHPAGFYDERIFLHIESGKKAAVIHYTLDGSEPTATSPVYTSALPLTQSKVVKARSFNSAQEPGPVRTGTYFIGQTFSLPVVSLSTDPANLWDAKTGIYVLGDQYGEKYPFHGANFWHDWEKPVHLEFFEPDGIRGLNIDLGMKIQGASSRIYSQKSLSLFARKKYGPGKLTYPLFPNSTITEFEAITLRNSGTDWGISMIRDPLTATLATRAGLEVQAYRPAVVFINGAYWGIHNIREKINEHFIASHYRVDPDRIEILEDAGTPILGESTHYSSIIQFVENNDMSLASNFVRVEESIDIDNFIDYFAIQIYVGNNDWPGKNIKFWRENRPGGKWRWLLFDTDFGFARFNRANHNMLAYVSQPDSASDSPGRNPLWSTFLFRHLLDNPEFSKRFLVRVADLMNTTFRADTVISTIESMRHALAPEMPAHFERWSHPDFAPGIPDHLRHKGSQVEKWEKNVQVLIDFAQKRAAHMDSHIREAFNVQESARINLEVSPPGSGRIRVNRRFMVTSSWEGTYFAETPIDLEPIIRGNYSFAGWEGVTEAGAAVSFRPENGQNIVARFAANFGAVGAVVINEINYSSTKKFNPGDWVEIYNNANAPIDLSGWTFGDNSDNQGFVIPQGTILGVGEYLVLCRQQAAFADHFPQVKYAIGNFDFGLNSQSDGLWLADAQGNTVDYLEYANSFPWPSEYRAQGGTIALKEQKLDNALGTNWTLSAQGGTPGAANHPLAPENYFVEQNFPNPFNATTSISYGTQQAAQVQIEIYDLLGQVVASFDLGRVGAGIHHFEFEASSLASGLYFYKTQMDNFVRTHKMVLLK